MTGTAGGVVAIVQARMGSRRMPGKVLAPLAGAPALQRICERVARAERIDRLRVATSTEPEDDPLAELCRERGIDCVRGSLGDVLGRFLQAAPADCAGVVRVTADCPLVDPELVDRHVAAWLEHRPRVEYVTNALRRTMPDGLDVEVFTRQLLEEADRHTRAPHDREHVTPWIQRMARKLHVTQETDLSLLRWTVDTPRDHEALAAIYEALHGQDPAFGAREVYRLLVDEPRHLHLAGEGTPSGTERAAWRARIQDHLARTGGER